MTKYGFDYFTKRVELLVEAGRPGKLGAAWDEYQRKISTVMKAGGEYPGYNIETGEEEVVKVPGFSENNQNKRYKYTIDTIVKFDNLDIKFSDDQFRLTKTGSKKFGSNKDDTSNAALKILGITDATTAGGASGPKLYAKAIEKWVSENPEKLLSKEFQDMYLNPDNILASLAGGRLSAQEHNTGDIKNKEIENIHGISREEYDILTSKAAPLLAKINRAHGNKFGPLDPKKAFTRPKLPDVASSESQKSSGGVYEKLDLNNNHTDNLIVLSGALKQYAKYIQYFKKLFIDESKKEAYRIYTNPIEKKDRIVKTLTEILKTKVILSAEPDDPEETVEKMLDADLGVFKQVSNLLKQALESGTGISLKAFFRVLNVIKTKNPDTEDTIELIYAYLGTVSAFNQQRNKARKEGEYRGFDPDTIAEFTQNPEDKALFDKWYDVIFFPQEQERNEKLMAIASGQMTANAAAEKRAFDTFTKHELNVKGQEVNRTGVLDNDDSDEYKERLKTELESKPEDEWTGLEYAEAKRLGLLKKGGNREEVTPEMEDEAINVIRKQTRDTFGRQVKNESYVMGYMTEQFKKDKFKPRGEFKERGFKKPTNYWQGRNL